MELLQNISDISCLRVLVAKIISANKARSHEVNEENHTAIQTYNYTRRCSCYLENGKIGGWEDWGDGVMERGNNGVMQPTRAVRKGVNNSSG